MIALFVFPGAFSGAAGLAAAAADAPAPVLSHQAHLKFDLGEHSVLIKDRIMVPAGLTEMRLGAGFTIIAMTSLDDARLDLNVTVEEAADEDGPFQRLLVQPMGLRNGGPLTLTYTGIFNESVKDVVFSRENVGNEITATISDEGIYLSSAAGWLVTAEGTLATHELAIDTPSGFETVTQGERVMHQDSAEGLHTRWVADRPSDGINLIANRYVVHEDPIRAGLVGMTFFLSDDARLRATYLERTRAYLAMYEEMIGPYPYAKFATVENWFPTGYGMPSYTLLGSQVLRLPFIPYTSFGHEIAHNWWGNSVFVDLGEGNWCEGLTVYCADYHYKALESAGAAREYRRNALKDYAAYVSDPAHDFPLSGFRSRHSGATRAVGYGKSMMVFHMAERLVGAINFGNALRVVAADHQYAAAAWSDFMAAFAEAGGRDLATFQEQWLTRTGAPELRLERADFQDDHVTLVIAQSEPAYDLEVPVVVTAADGTTEHVVRLAAATGEFTFAGPGIRQVAVDPDYHLFRRLHPQEIEATISQVLADAQPNFVAEVSDAVAAFAGDWTEDAGGPAAISPVRPVNGHVNIIVNPAADRLERLLPPELQVVGARVFLAGKRYDRDKFDLVFAVADPDDPAVTDLVVLCDAPERLRGLAGRISHYGKYSWLLLPAGTGAAERGNWTPGDSPLVAARGAR